MRFLGSPWQASDHRRRIGENRPAFSRHAGKCGLVASAVRLLAGHVAVKERVNAIALAPAEDFRRDSDLFGEGVRHPEAQSRIKAAIKRGFQTRDAEMDLAPMLEDLGGI